jgi:phosphoenolpyruvate carboxykinase (ATP)
MLATTFVVQSQTKGKLVDNNAALDAQGIRNPGKVHWNLSVQALYEAAILRGEASLASGGALLATTGEHTGRSPKDKFIVRDDVTEKSVDWGPVNQEMSSDQFERLYQRMMAYLQGRELFVRDAYGGADEAYRLRVRVVNEFAWHNLFCANMFIRPPATALAGFVPDFTIIQAPGFQADPAIDGCKSGTVIAMSFTHKLVLIGGTSYAGEAKKSVFSYLNHVLPGEGVMPMHCSANIGANGESAVFFGLSGTGKTTLSADASRTLIGDDEHGWSGNGLFNFEGGCYAKVINLSKEAEPEIFEASHRFGTVLENVVMDPDTRVLNLEDSSLTENTRSSYPLEFIKNASETGTGPSPKNVIMLTADAFGVLPPISKMTAEQAMYHFLSGYTARVAGTEKGVDEPQATFSTCFGAPFMTRHPSAYSKLLGEKILGADVTCWLVNTGWSGGAYGVGSRMKIAHTRALVSAALDGGLTSVETVQDPIFGLHIPQSCPGVPDEVLTPRNTWADKDAYDATAKDLASRFEENFKKYEDYVGADVKAVAIRAS